MTETTGHRELTDADFSATFGMDKDAFGKLPKWKQNSHKKKYKLY